MKRYVKSSEQSTRVAFPPEPIGYGPTLKIDNMSVRKTDYATYQVGRFRRVYEDTTVRPDGNRLLYYTFNNHLNIVDFGDCSLQGPMSWNTTFK